MGKVILTLIDGMRPDALLACGNDYVDFLKKESSYIFDAKSVIPPVTLPCHVSLFHSVPPDRHGTLTNTYTVPVNPINGLFEQINKADKNAAMFYSWEKLRDVCNPGCLMASELLKIKTVDAVDCRLTDKTLSFVEEFKPDFVFLYLGETDDIGGHRYGWMTEEYLQYINVAVECVKKVIQAVGDEYTVIVTADHGGHERTHGTNIPEDMNIPIFFRGEKFEANKELCNVSLLDIAPTIAEIMDLTIPEEWEGKSMCNH